jgi:hypothetical protein
MAASFREALVRLTGKGVVRTTRLAIEAALGFTTLGVIAVIPADAADRHIAGVPAPPLRVVSEDPYTNPGTYHRTQVEPVSAAFGSTIVSVFQSGRSYNWGASNLGWSMSTDAGATWTDGFLPGTTIHATPSGKWQRVTDAAIAYDARHQTWVIVALGARPCSLSGTCAGARVFVSRSTDGAQTFEEPLIPRRPSSMQFFDEPWIACDNSSRSPFYGNCYMVWVDGWHRELLHAYTSSDGGLTWAWGRIRPNHHCVGEPRPAVQPSGTVVIGFTEDCQTYKGRTFISTSGGASYVGPFDIPSYDQRGPAGDLRASPIPPARWFDVDAAGRIYSAWSDCAFRLAEDGCTHNDIVLSTSDDGRHWTDMFRVPIDPVTSSADHFLPAIAVDKQTSGDSAHIAIVYYFHPEQWCDRRTCQLYVGLVSSTDGGSTWKVEELAGPFKHTWFPLTSTGFMVGEYIGISFVDGRAIPVFPVASEGRCKLGDLYSCNVWTASATIPASGQQRS